MTAGCIPGDVGRLDAEGYLYLVDRKKDMIISGGENVYSREVEEAVVTTDAVSEVAVIGVPDAKWGEAVMAIVVLKSGRSATAGESIDHCRQHDRQLQEAASCRLRRTKSSNCRAARSTRSGSGRFTDSPEGQAACRCGGQGGDRCWSCFR